MDPKDYREQFEAELREAADRGDVAPAAEAERAALDDLALSGNRFDILLAVLVDEHQPTGARTEALVGLQQLSLRMVSFPAKRPAYLAALRSLVDVEDMGLRRRVVGILARAKDEYVQRRLMDGMQPGNRSLVPLAKAIQFLGYDVHAEHFPLLRGIVADPPSHAAKLEAVRVLAADPASVPLLAGLVRDSSERPEIRRQAAVGLQSLAPATFAATAVELAEDATAPDALRALALTALTLFDPPGPAAAQPTGSTSAPAHPVAGVDDLAATETSVQLRKAARAYVARRDG